MVYCTLHIHLSYTMQTSNIKEQLHSVSLLLRDKNFAQEMAQYLEAAYYTSKGEEAPAFSEEGIHNRYTTCLLIEEKIAVSIAAFYALECAIGQLIYSKGGNPFDWLIKIKDRTTDEADRLVMHCFANAAWKAGQPYRGIDRITRDNFISAYFLPEAEIKKDLDQVYAAALLLKKEIMDVANSSVNIQLEKISRLLQNESFALEIAQHLEAAYYTDTHQPAPVFLKKGEETAETKRSLIDEKIAINISGFYALESGLSYLALSQHSLPSDIVHAIITDSISAKDKQLLARFANLTWKAGQPFRGLHRIRREIFTPFDLLPQNERFKDWVQIKAAAQKLKDTLHL